MTLHMTIPLDEVEFAVIDIETTDFHGEPVEVAVVIGGADGTVRDEWSTLVRAATPIHPRACQVHGLRDDHLAGAPVFGDLLGDLDELLEGRVLAGHEVAFDLRVLTEAYASNGHTRAWPAVCTRQLGFPGTLESEATAHGYAHVDGTWHQALPDARAAAALLCGALDRARSVGASTLADVTALHPGVASLLGVMPSGPASLARSGKVFTRLHRAGSVPGGLELVSRVVGQLPPPLARGRANDYVALVWRALADRLLTGDEVRELVGLAVTTGLTPADVQEAHHQCFRRVAAAAAADHVISAPEQRDLACVARLLRIDPNTAEAVLREEIAAAIGHASTPTVPDTTLPVGTRVVVTGEVPYTSGGRPITRSDMAALMTSAGLVPKKAVSGLVDLVVLCDPTSGSRKAEEARIRGIPIMIVEEFLEALGVVTD